MNGPHDMGGMHAFGAINPEPEETEPLFHEPWERKALALTLACGALGQWSIDEARSVRESLDPALYTSSSYYRKWIEALTRQMVEKGLLTSEELETATVRQMPEPGSYRVLNADAVDKVYSAGGPTSMDIDNAPLFQVGDLVLARNMNPIGHTRIPRYVRGHVGEIVLWHGGHVFADDSARGVRRGEHLYTVQFMARDLWGPEAAAQDSVMVDLWEPYLEAP